MFLCMLDGVRGPGSVYLALPAPSVTCAHIIETLSDLNRSASITRTSSWLLCKCEWLMLIDVGCQCRVHAPPGASEIPAPDSFREPKDLSRCYELSILSRAR